MATIQNRTGLPDSKCRTWSIKASRTVDGRREVRCATFHGSKRDANAYAAKWETECWSEPSRKDRRQTFAEWSATWLHEREVSGRYATRTLKSDRDRIGAMVRFIGDLPMSTIKAEDIASMWRDMAEGRTHTGTALSPGTLLDYTKTLKTCLNSACKCGVMKPINVPSPPRRVEQTRDALTDAQAAGLIGALVPRESMHSVLALALGCGLRRSEALALQWSDIREESVFINKSVDESGALKPPKSKAGHRAVPMPEWLLGWLISRRMAYCWDESDYVCGMPGERSPLPHSVTTWWRRNRSAFGLDGVSIHSLRHTFLTMLARSGVHPRVMQELAGDSTRDVVMQVYTHVHDEERRSAIKALDFRLGEHLGSIGFSAKEKGQTDLPPDLRERWSGEQDLNLRPLDPQSRPTNKPRIADLGFCDGCERLGEQSGSKIGVPLKGQFQLFPFDF